MELGAVRRDARPAVGEDVRAAVRPVAWAGEQTLPVVDALAPLFPEGLRRGEVLAVDGPAAVSCALALAAGPSAAGAWTLAAGLGGAGVIGGLGVGAAVGLGVAPDRLVVLDPGRLDLPAWAAALTAAVDGFDVVLVRPAANVTPAVWRRLGPRLRDRGGVLVGVDLPPGWERASTVRAVHVGWEGVGDGHGHLRARRAVLERVGRGAASRPRRAEVLLPGPDGRVAPAAPAVAPAPAVVDLPVRRVG